MQHVDSRTSLRGRDPHCNKTGAIGSLPLTTSWGAHAFQSTGGNATLQRAPSCHHVTDNVPQARAGKLQPCLDREQHWELTSSPNRPCMCIMQLRAPAPHPPAQCTAHDPCHARQRSRRCLYHQDTSCRRRSYTAPCGYKHRRTGQRTYSTNGWQGCDHIERLL